MPVIHIPDTASSQDMSAVNEYLETDNPSFVLLYMNGCGPCSQTHPKWKKLEKKFANDDSIGIFDIEMSRMNDIENKKLTEDVAGFPTMRYINGNVCEDYEKCEDITKDRSYESFLAWIKKKKGVSSGGEAHMLGGRRKKRTRTRKTRRVAGRTRTRRKRKATSKSRGRRTRRRKTMRRLSRKGGGKKRKRRNVRAAEEDVVGLVTDSLADGAVLAA